MAVQIVHPVASHSPGRPGPSQGPWRYHAFSMGYALEDVSVQRLGFSVLILWLKLGL